MYKNVIQVEKVHPNIRRIFQDSYKVRIPSGMIKTIEEYEFEPDLLSGDKSIDAHQGKQLVTLYITPEKMVEYHREGIPFYICESKDAAKIYEALVDHTSAWRDSLMFDLNSVECPAQDLLDMEKFAMAIYDIAKYEFSTEIYRNPLETLRARLGINANVMSKTAPVKPKLQEVKELKYEPNVDLFREALLRATDDRV